MGTGGTLTRCVCTDFSSLTPFPWWPECSFPPGTGRPALPPEVLSYFWAEQGMVGMLFLHLLVFQVLLARDRPCANAAYFGVSYSVTLPVEAAECVA